MSKYSQFFEKRVAKPCIVKVLLFLAAAHVVFLWMEFCVRLFIFYHLAIWNFKYPDTVGLMARLEFGGNCVGSEDVQSSVNWTMQLCYYNNAVCDWNESYRTNNSWQEIRVADPKVLQRLLPWLFQHKIFSWIVLCVAELVYFHCGVHLLSGVQFHGRVSS